MQRMESLSEPIDDMTEFFKTIIDERAVRVRRLSKPSAEGAIIDPASLAQSYVDVRAGNDHPQAYQDYEWREREREVTGKFDIFLVVDNSGSMHFDNGHSAQMATDSSIIIMEGLDSFMEMIRAREGQDRVRLDLDVRTALYAFGSEAHCLKELSHDLDRKERLDIFASMKKEMGGTADFLALEQILSTIQQEEDGDKRQRIILFVADGGSNDPERLQLVVAALQQEGCIVLPVGIGENADDIQQVFGADTEMVGDVDQLPEQLTSKLKDAIKANL